MKFELIPLRAGQMAQFKKDMQAAFQQGAEDTFGVMEEQILPESHIDRSLAEPGAVALAAMVDGEMAGGAVVVLDEQARHGHLDLLYVKNGVHSKGIGQAIWRAIEARFPEIQLWETVTPYFEKRNIHFYVNKCGFHIVEFYNKYDPDPNDPEGTYSEGSPEAEYFDGMFRFEKRMGPL